MNSIEFRAVWTLSAIMSLRMLGLFMILPIFSLYAMKLSGTTPFLLGIALGIYGLTQALFQIPLGAWSDHIGRKKVIALGLILFAMGSLLAAEAHSIEWMIVGRALQGAGAVGSTIMACVADVTRDSQRTKAMAFVGISIGMSFSLAMVLGPLLHMFLTVNNLFWLAVLFSLLALVLLFFLVPTPETISWHADTEAEFHSFFSILKNKTLLQLNLGIFILHAIFTASFVVIPISLQPYFASAMQWKIYLPVLLIAFLFTIPLVVTAEKKHCLKQVFLSTVAMLGIAELLLWNFSSHLLISAGSLLLFFTAFSVLEAFLPSLVSKTAPRQRKGTALGLYSCSQFLGIFFGGAMGGFLYGKLSLSEVYLFCVVLAVIWMMVAFQMKNPQHS